MTPKSTRRSRRCGRRSKFCSAKRHSVPNEPPIAPPQLVDQLEMPNDLIKAASAAALARRAKPTICAWCRKNAIDGERGFSIKIGAQFYIQVAATEAPRQACERFERLSSRAQAVRAFRKWNEGQSKTTLARHGC
jgi:hypothetical protein